MTHREPLAWPRWALYLATIAKALAGAVVAGAGYLMGVLPEQATLADVTTVQWLGLMVSVLGTFGIVYAIPNRSR